MTRDTAPQLRLDVAAWDRLCRSHGLTTVVGQADWLGVNRSHLSELRSGRRSPGPLFMAKVRAAFPEADVESLFRLTGTPTR